MRIIVLIILLLCPLRYEAEAGLPDGLCKEEFRSACTIPFELVFTNRDDLFGQYISLDGIILFDRSRESANELSAYFFPSSERAIQCNLETSIRIDREQAWVELEVAAFDRRPVRLRGVLSTNGEGQWATLQLKSELTPISGRKMDSSCFTWQSEVEAEWENVVEEKRTVHPRVPE